MSKALRVGLLVVCAAYGVLLIIMTVLSNHEFKLSVEILDADHNVIDFEREKLEPEAIYYLKVSTAHPGEVVSIIGGEATPQQMILAEEGEGYSAKRMFSVSRPDYFYRITVRQYIAGSEQVLERVVNFSTWVKQ